MKRHASVLRAYLRHIFQYTVLKSVVLLSYEYQYALQFPHEILTIDPVRRLRIQIFDLTAVFEYRKASRFFYKDCFVKKKKKKNHVKTSA